MVWKSVDHAIRAGVLCCVAQLPAFPAPASPVSRSLEFEVSLDSRPVGRHSFRLLQNPDGTLEVQSRARFDVRLFGLVVYRYRHEAAEHWSSGCLTAIDALTEDNGRRLQVTGGTREDDFTLEEPTSGTLSRRCVHSYAYWDPDSLLLQDSLLNPQTGTLDAVSFDSLGMETVSLQDRPIRARHFRLRREDSAIDLWYSEQGDWLQLETTVRHRHVLRYRRVPGPESGQ